MTGIDPPETGIQPTPSESEPRPPETESQPPATGSRPPVIVPIPENELQPSSQPETTIQKLDHPVSMEVEAPPAIISPMSSPEKESPWEIINLSEWPEELSASLNKPKNSDDSFTITTIINANNSNSAMSSLKKTFKKCNLRSIEPKQIASLNSEHWILTDGEFAFKFKFISKNIKPTFFNIKNNWMSTQQSQLSGFFIKNIPGFFFKNS